MKSLMQEMSITNLSSYFERNFQLQIFAESNEREDTPHEEMINSITHGIGVLASVIVLLLMISEMNINNYKSILSVVLYGGSMLSVFSFSTLLHIFYSHRHAKLLQILDHASIYWVIAGTYTPIVLLLLPHENNYLAFGVLWVLAIIGTVAKFVAIDKFPLLSVAIYVLKGCSIFFLWLPTIMLKMGDGFYWMAFGGAAYLIGVIFFLWKRLMYSHAIWHMFVNAGTLFMFIGIYGYVL